MKSNPKLEESISNSFKTEKYNKIKGKNLNSLSFKLIFVCVILFFHSIN